jgi:hypothetical protein
MRNRRRPAFSADTVATILLIAWAGRLMLRLVLSHQLRRSLAAGLFVRRFAEPELAH